jgi:RNA polymerase sigma factor (TIGR02999 family)
MDETRPPSDALGQVTTLLQAWRGGDGAALEQLLPLVYDELRQLARSRLRHEREGHLLQPTALVHEAFLRLVRQSVDWQGRAHFFGVAARLMRNVAVDHWRAEGSLKRGGQATRVDLGDRLGPAEEPRSVDLLALDDALTRLEAMSPHQARAVELRFFGGLELDEIAEVTGRSRATVVRDLRAAKAWLFRELSAEPAPG